MANDFAMVYRGIFDGSFHDAPPYAKLVLIAMMMDASADGMVRFFPETWAARIPCTPDEARAALDILKAPDPHDSSGVEDGRRIIDHGGNLYEIVNYPAYRQHRTAIERREYMRQKQAEHRARKAEKAQVPDQPAKSVSKKAPKEDVFVAPNLEECAAYFVMHLGRSEEDAGEFWRHFENCRWKLSSGRGAKMKDWHLAAQNWGRNQFVNGRAAPQDERAEILKKLEAGS